MHNSQLNIKSVNNGQQPFLSNLYFAFFLRKIGQGEFVEAQDHLAKAIKLFPGFTAAGLERLSQLIVDYVFSQSPIPPLALAQCILDNLPNNFVEQSQLRQRVLGKIHIARAFEKFEMGDSAQARHHIINGLKYDPSYIKNKGVLSILVKSIIQNRQIIKKPIHRNQPIETKLQPIINAVEKILGQPAEIVKPINPEYKHSLLTSSPSPYRPPIHALASTSRRSNKFFIEAGGHSYLLRLVKNDTLKPRVAIANQLQTIGFPAPAVAGFGSSGETVDKVGWLLEEWRDGTWFDPSNQSKIGTLSILADLGCHLQQLHTIKTNGFGQLKTDTLDTPYSSFSDWLTSRQQIVELGCTLGVIPSTALAELAKGTQFLKDSFTGHPVLCHCDLAHGNILVNNEHVTSIIDWEDSEGNDPAYDIAVFFTRMSIYWSLPQRVEFLNSILQKYRTPDKNNFFHRVVAHQLLFAATELVRLSSGDEEAYFNACQDILKKPINLADVPSS